MKLRTMAFGALAAIALGTGAVAFAQTPPVPQGPPPPPPLPSTGPSSAPLITSSAAPTALPSNVAPPTTAPDGSAAPAPGASGPTPAAGRKGHRTAGTPVPSPAPSPTDTPEPPQFSTLDGVWEVAFQPLSGARTIYSHLYVTQKGNDLTGTWRRDPKTTLPFTGTFDGRLLKLSVTGGTTTYLFSGYEENYMDMVGLFTDGDGKHAGTPFTAAHRRREKDRDVRVK